MSLLVNDLEILPDKDTSFIKKLKKKPLYKPVLRTGQPPLRPRTLRQGLLCLQKRNCDVPDNNVIIDPATVQENFSKFTEAYFHDQVNFSEFENNPIDIDEKNVLEWMTGSKPEKLARLGPLAPVEDYEWIKYQMMIKTEPKNKLEIGATKEYLALQNIVHNIPKVTAFWSSIFKELFRRFESCLKPNICVLIRKNAQEISEFFSKWLNPSNDSKKLEVDFSKYDKSQQEFCLLTETFIMKKLGLKQNLIEAWRQFHTITSATDYQSGIQAKFLYQRKTGDSFTCFGNTLVSMSALAACFDMKDLICAAFVGDDSLVFFNDLPYVQDGERDLRLMYNLESKVIIEGAPYFCSSFLVSNGSKYALIPDPLKRLERLGKCIYSTDEYASLHERWVSFGDQLQVLHDYAFYNSLCHAISSKYLIYENIEIVLICLYSLIKSEKKFNQLFKAVE